jgi:hypothetical protein
MKNTLLITLLSLSSFTAMARNCVPQTQPSTRCEVFVDGTSYSECHIIRSGNMFPETYRPNYHTHPWNREFTGEQKSYCDVELQECKDLAFRRLEKYTFTNNCGDVSVGKSVEFFFQVLNEDGTINAQESGVFKK